MPENFEIANYFFREDDPTYGHILYSAYTECPGAAFLKFCGQAAIQIERIKVVRQALQHSDRKTELAEELVHQSGLPLFEGSVTFAYTTAIQHFVNAMLASIMGNFETYQKHLFAGIFDRTQMLQFNEDSFFRRLKWDKDTISVGTKHILSYRGVSDRISPGLLIADNLGGWHNPDKVNEYFAAFGSNRSGFQNIYSNENEQFLRCLWQLRHSIVHTASTITPADALKVRELERYSGRNIVFSNNFIYEVTAQMHYLVRDVNRRIGDAFEAASQDLTDEEIHDKNSFLGTDVGQDGHPRASDWLS